MHPNWDTQPEPNIGTYVHALFSHMPASRPAHLISHIYTKARLQSQKLYSCIHVNKIIPALLSGTYCVFPEARKKPLHIFFLLFLPQLLSQCQSLSSAMLFESDNHVLPLCWYHPHAGSQRAVSSLCCLSHCPTVSPLLNFFQSLSLANQKKISTLLSPCLHQQADCCTECLFSHCVFSADGCEGR